MSPAENTKVTPEEKKTYDSLMKVMKELNNNIELIDNTLTNNSKKADGKDDEKGAAIAMIHMSAKALEVKENLPKDLIFKEK